MHKQMCHLMEPSIIQQSTSSFGTIAIYVSHVEVHAHSIWLLQIWRSFLRLNLLHKVLQSFIYHRRMH